jgi:Fe-S cluster assembly protein SufD
MTAPSVNLPTARDENWKYANLRGLARARFEPSAAPSEDALARVAAALPAPLEGYERVVLVDGHLATSLSSVDASAAPTRSTVSRLETDRAFADLNRRLCTETAAITVKAHQKRAVEMIVVALGTSHPAIELTLAEGSELAFIERHLPLSGESTITNLAISARVGAHARLELSRIVQAGAKAQHVETLELHLDEGSSSKLVQLTTGATASRTTAFVDHAGRDSSLEWHAAALGEGTQSHDSYVRIAHSAPSARTLQQFRGIASGRSRVSFNGHMRVDAISPNAQSDQSLKCLLAGPEAEADVRPQLEIYTDAVKASHGATVGKLDPDMLFYLLSRGIPEDAAAALLKWAFVSDVLTRLPNPALRTAVEHSLEALLPGAVAARSST